VFHFITIFWKLLFALVPPPKYAHGWATFGIALLFIGILSYTVADFATQFGCVLNISPSITAITFVALGTSLPDTFASMGAARMDPNADPALGNVTGSNAVNVFLGLGIPWVIGSHYDTAKIKNNDNNYMKDPKTKKVIEPRVWNDAMYPPYEGFWQPAGSLGFSVLVFALVGTIGILTLVARRFIVGGELGGVSASGRYGSCIFFCTLWLIYIVFSILQEK